MEKIRIDAIEGPVKINACVPGSKSIIARAMVLGALSDGKTIISGAVLSEDGRTMLNALRDLGFKVYYNASLQVVRVFGCGGEVPYKNATIYVGSAGTAARFLTAMLGFQDGTYVVNASAQLCARPMKGLIEALRSVGVKVTCLNKEGHLPIEIKGRSLKEDETLSISVDSEESTQFVSGLLMALACKKNESVIKAKSLTHDAYIKMTLEMIRQCGADAREEEDCYIVHASDGYITREIVAEPDVSAACYFYAATMLLGGSAYVERVTGNEVQGDLELLKLIEILGGKVSRDESGVTVFHEKGTMAEGDFEFDMADFSDQVATMAVICAARKGKTKIKNIAHIRKQECDRISVICDNLTKCGITVKEGKDYIEITGGTPKGARIDPHNDHRMAMAFSTLGLLTGNMLIKNPECVKKTFDGFYDEISKIG